MKYKLVNIGFILIFFFLIISNYLSPLHLYSFGDSFFLFDEEVKIKNIFSYWNQSYNFGEIFVRNNFSLVFILLIKKYLFGNINFVFFQKIYILFSISLSFISAIIFYKIFKKSFINNNNIQKSNLIPEYFYFCIFFFLNPYVLQYIINVDFAGFIAFLSGPLVIVIYYKFITKFNYKYFFLLILSFIYLYSVYNNVLIKFSLYLSIIPFFFYFYFKLKFRYFIIRNFFYFFILIFFNLPAIYFSILPLIQLDQISLSKSIIQDNEVWFKWTSHNSSFYNIIQGQSYMGWSENREIISTVWNFYDYIKINIFGKLFSFLYILGFLFFLISNKFKYKKIILFFCLILIFISKGAHFPFGFVNLWLYEKIFILSAFRTIFYLSLPLIPFFALFTVIFIKSSLAEVKKFSRIKFIALSIMINFLIVSMIFNTYGGNNFISGFMKVSIPNELYELSKKINEIEDQRFISIPFLTNSEMKKIWKLNINGDIFNHLINKELITKNEGNINNQIIEDFLNDEIKYDEANNLFRFYGVSHIFLSKDNSIIANGNRYALMSLPSYAVDFPKLYKKLFNNKFYYLYFIENNKIIDIPEKIIIYD